ncbi:MAG: RadC family protein [Gemmatimonadaceae bacterium]
MPKPNKDKDFRSPISHRVSGVRELPPSERPRERLTSHGASRLSTIELLAIVLGSGHRRQSTLSLAHHALAASGGSLRRIASEPVSALTAISGIGKARAAMIHAALELGRRMLQETRQEGLLVRAPHDIYRVFGPRLEDLPVEEFHVAVLDAQHRLQRDILVSRGILNSSLVHPREVFREAIAERAASVVLVHNHPSGDPNPSLDDRLVTDQLVAAGEVVGIAVRDHLVVGRGRYVSFVESGLMPGDRRRAS